MEQLSPDIYYDSMEQLLPFKGIVLFYGLSGTNSLNCQTYDWCAAAALSSNDWLVLCGNPLKGLTLLW
jgi:hypothetical protein